MLTILYIADYALALFDCLMGAASLCYLIAFVYFGIKPLFIGAILKMVSIALIGAKEVIEASTEKGENIFRAFKILFRLGVLIVILSACLKLDGAIEWEWIKVIWPIWVMFCFLALFLVVMWCTIAIKAARLIIIRRGRWREVKSFTWIALNF